MSGAGWALVLLAAAYLGFAVVAAAQVPGHWWDVARIAGVCACAVAVAGVLVRVGRARQRPGP